MPYQKKTKSLKLLAKQVHLKSIIYFINQSKYEEKIYAKYLLQVANFSLPLLCTLALILLLFFITSIVLL